ncbi:hypothetical protein EVAR_44680_1 [Eumeta japonica]|uniref:Uncharacterized protein n=1 Tax=Eumeta variegata TaxID=151549 RepID=A0A4C1Y180_EUMVA|nr:hypothetical protein EVAR_44680_1 [Eumeta japonica]
MLSNATWTAVSNCRLRSEIYERGREVELQGRIVFSSMMTDNDRYHYKAMTTPVTYVLTRSGSHEAIRLIWLELKAHRSIRPWVYGGSQVLQNAACTGAKRLIYSNLCKKRSLRGNIPFRWMPALGGGGHAAGHLSRRKNISTVFTQ